MGTIPPVVHVVTSGPDWVTIILPVVTGFVGILGTGLGTWLTGRKQTLNLQLSISAEEARLRRDEKRQVYAAFLASINQEVTALARYRNSKTHKMLELPWPEVLQAGTISSNNLLELALIAPDNIVKYANDLSIWIGKLNVDITKE